jgi:hypothetical protein
MIEVNLSQLTHDQLGQSDPSYKSRGLTMNYPDTYIPIEYLEEVADQLELTVDYLIDEFVIDGQLELELFIFPLCYQR